MWSHTRSPSASWLLFHHQRGPRLLLNTYANIGLNMPLTEKLGHSKQTSETLLSWLFPSAESHSANIYWAPAPCPEVNQEQWTKWGSLRRLSIVSSYHLNSDDTQLLRVGQAGLGAQNTGTFSSRNDTEPKSQEQRGQLCLRTGQQSPEGYSPGHRESSFSWRLTAHCLAMQVLCKRFMARPPRLGVEEGRVGMLVRALSIPGSLWTMSHPSTLHHIFIDMSLPQSLLNCPKAALLAWLDWLVFVCRAMRP